MSLKIGLFCCMFLSVCFSASYAQEMFSLEAVTYYNEGVKAQKGHDFEKANEWYRKVLLLEPHNLNWQKYILNNRGNMYYHDGSMDLAEEAFNEALKIDPNYQAPKENLGFIYEKKRTELESIKYWMKLYNIDLEKYKPKGLVLQQEEESKK